jgi:hypothetical protein
LSYVGNDYKKQNDTRLVIVGMDHGENISGDYEERTQGIEQWYYIDKYLFNPHYKGVIRTAAAILGTEGQQCWKICWPTRQCRGDNQKTNSFCVLKRICQPNLVKCVSAPDRSCLSTHTMQNNCAKHLLNELAELDPTVVVFHGRGARKPFQRAVQEESGAELMPVPGSPCHQEEEILWILNNRGKYSYALFLAHPSRGWLARTWDSEFLPALRLIQAQAGWPNTGSSKYETWT